MKKKRLGNIVMVLLIAVIAVTGVLTALHLRGGGGMSAPSPSSATPFLIIWGRWTRKKRPMFPKTR